MTAIDVWYFDENAVTRTLVADIVRTSEKGPVKLYILYRNEPITNQFTGFNSHTGVMDLVVDEARKRIAGIYFNNPHERATYGELRVEYSGPRRFGSFKRE